MRLAQYRRLLRYDVLIRYVDHVLAEQFVNNMTGSNRLVSALPFMEFIPCAEQKQRLCTAGRRTKKLRAVQLLLLHTKLESTVRYLGIEVDDVL